MAPGSNFTSVISKLIIQNSSFNTRCVIVLWWMPQKLIHGKSTLVQVMTWCRQATSHYGSHHELMLDFGCLFYIGSIWSVITFQFDVLLLDVDRCSEPGGVSLKLISQRVVSANERSPRPHKSLLLTKAPLADFTPCPSFINVTVIFEFVFCDGIFVMSVYVDMHVLHIEWNYKNQLLYKCLLLNKCSIQFGKWQEYH